MEGFCKQKHLRQPLVSELPDGFALLMHHIRGRATRVAQCDTTSAKQKDRSKSCLFVLAEMSGFEPPRRLSRPTPLAGAPLRPLEYISKCTQPRLHKPPFRSLPFNYTQFYSDCQYLFVFSLISFQNASNLRTTNGCPYDQNQRSALYGIRASGMETSIGLYGIAIDVWNQPQVAYSLPHCQVRTCENGRSKPLPYR